ncbi:MAG: hypothetical protein K5678_10170, partial [Acetatifactor sp.]|nr:hypothetical protein [Acetatifactor sp.]
MAFAIDITLLSILSEEEGFVKKEAFVAARAGSAAEARMQAFPTSAGFTGRSPSRKSARRRQTG